MFKFKTSFLGSIIGMQDQKAADLDIAALIQEAKSPEIQALLKQFGDENGLLKEDNAIDNIVPFEKKDN